MNKPKILIKTGQSAVKQDKNGRNYKTVTFTQLGASEVIQDEILGEIVVEGKEVSTSVNCYEKNYLGQADWGFGAPIFDSANPKGGGATFGAIVQRKVDGYNIDVNDSLGLPTGEVRTVDSYKTAIFADSREEESFEIAVRGAFRNAGHPLTDEDKALIVQAAERKAARETANDISMVGAATARK